jgi:hypothetical protein
MVEAQIFFGFDKSANLVFSATGQFKEHCRRMGDSISESSSRLLRDPNDIN